MNNSILIGYDSRPLADNSSNEIVIGASAIGNGDYTTTIGGASTTDTYLKGNVHVSNALKISGGTPGLGKVLTSDADGLASWASPASGVSSVGSIGSATANGASITSGVLSLAPANGTNPGIVTTSAQTFAGAKTYSSNLTAPGFVVVSGTSSQFLKADGSTDATTYVPKNTSKISIGSNAADSNQGLSAIAIGTDAGVFDQNVNSIAIGKEAAYYQNGANAIAIGERAGYLWQLSNAIAIGNNSGKEDQLENSIAIGNNAGYFTQRYNSIAIGNNAGNYLQNDNSIAIGNEAGKTKQGGDYGIIGIGSSAIAIGYEAGKTNQGQDAIAIGKGAGLENQAAHSIILNASGSALNSGNTGFFVDPIRSGTNGSGINYLYFDVTSKEIKYSTQGFASNEFKANTIYTGGLGITSDLRLKSNIEALPSSLNMIKKLNPVSYKKKDNIASTQYTHEEMGFIAQEIQKVMPMLVIEGSDKDKTLSVNYISLVPVLTKAIQEQQTQIEEKAKLTDELKKQLDRQQKEIDELRELIKSIKK
jgi:hypothetical protein